MRLQLTWVLELTSIRFQFKPKHAKFKNCNKYPSNLFNFVLS